MAKGHFLVCYDQAGDAALREELRGQHIGFRKGLGPDLILAGPLLGEDGAPNGSVVILAAADLADARSIADRDPYVQAGVLVIRSLNAMRIAALQPPADG